MPDDFDFEPLSVLPGAGSYGLNLPPDLTAEDAEEGDITCWDGSKADNYSKCPLPPFDYQTPEEWFDEQGRPDWMDDPATTGFKENEFQTYVFEEMYGGEEGTGMYQTEWWDQYGHQFPSFEDSTYYDRYVSALKQLGSLTGDIERAGEAHIIQEEGLKLSTRSEVQKSTAALEDISVTAESEFYSSGGVYSGRKVKKYEAAVEDTNRALTLELTGLDLDKKLLDLGYEGELAAIQDKQFALEDKLLGIEQSYEDQLESRYLQYGDLGDFCKRDDQCGEGGICNQETGLCEMDKTSYPQFSDTECLSAGKHWCPGANTCVDDPARCSELAGYEDKPLHGPEAARQACEDTGGFFCSMGSYGGTMCVSDQEGCQEAIDAAKVDLTTETWENECGNCNCQSPYGGQGGTDCLEKCCGQVPDDGVLNMDETAAKEYCAGCNCGGSEVCTQHCCEHTT